MTTREDRQSYRDPSLSIDDRVADLLERMTLEEKIGQLAGSYVGTLDEGLHGVDDVIDEIDEYHIGAVAPFGWGGSPNESAADAVDAARRLQKHAVEETRLGIPLLFAADAIHGHAYIAEATVFPNGLGKAATWSPGLLERLAEITATELRATGAAQNYSPTCDVARDQRWGRTGETFGESPTLVGALAAAEVRGYQGERLDADSVLATAKHFPAYGDPERGEDAAPVDVSSRTLRNVFLPPFEAALEEGVGAVMPCYNSIDGEPAHGSPRFLTDLLRDELGFEGVVVSDWNGVAQLHEEHRTAGSPLEAARQTRLAGLDLGSVAGADHARHLRELVERGDLSERLLEDSVERILRAKFALGLFEDPYPDPEPEATLGAPEHLETAREAVRKSLTLLQNDGDVLPLEGDLEEVFVTGPNADEMVHQNGGWSCTADGVPGTTILEGIADVVDDGTAVTHEPGSRINEPVDVDAAAERAAEADVAVVALGEDWYLHEFGPSAKTASETGEFPTRNELSLPDAQQELVDAVAATGTPVVAVLVTGRPLAVERLAETVPAILMAYYPGRVGGEVIAETLFGESEPGGRLPISMPRSAESLPTYFNHRPHPHPIGPDEHPPSYDPLFEFGHGLSYTTLEYESVDLDGDEIRPGEAVTISATVANTGDRRGSEVVQVFGRDEFSAVVTPVRELWAFERVDLEPGERATVDFRIDPVELGLFGRSRDGRLNDGWLQLSVADRTFDLEVRSQSD